MSNNSEYPSNSVLEVRAVCRAVIVFLVCLFALLGYGCHLSAEKHQARIGAEQATERRRVEQGLVPKVLPGTNEVVWVKPVEEAADKNDAR